MHLGIQGSLDDLSKSSLQLEALFLSATAVAAPGLSAVSAPLPFEFTKALQLTVPGENLNLHGPRNCRLSGRGVGNLGGRHTHVRTSTHAAEGLSFG